jgi:hypothetical protein
MAGKIKGESEVTYENNEHSRKAQPVPTEENFPNV